MPQVWFPSTPVYYAEDPRHETRHADTRAYEPQNEPKTVYWDTCSALLRDRLCVPLLLVGVFDSEQLHMLNRSDRHWLFSCRLAASLAAIWAAGLAALFVQGFHEVWQLWKQAWQQGPAPVASNLPQEHCE